MALDPLNDDQLAELSDEDLDARMEAERNEGLSDEPEEVIEDMDPVDEVIEDEDPIEEDPIEDDEPIESDDEVDDEDEEPSAEPEDNLDGDPTDPEDVTEPETSETPQEFKPLRIDGNDVAINSMEELYALASAGGQFTQKMQEISQYKKSLAVMQQNNLTEADLSLLIEARNGNKDAIASILKQSGVDTMELEEEPSADYRPGAYIPSDTQVSIMEVQREISNDPEYQITQNVVNNMMDTQSQDMMAQNPDMIRGIHQDIKSGVYQTVAAEANKLKMMDGGRHSDMEYYIAAAQTGEPQAQPQQQVTPVQEEKQKPARNSARRKAAGSSRPKVQPKKVIDFDDMDDDELMKYREQVMSR